jgi:hypothetical protein
LLQRALNCLVFLGTPTWLTIEWALFVDEKSCG